MKSNILELDGLSVARDGALLMPPLSYRLQSGDLLVIEGANGSGKSSLLKCIAGLLPAAAGDIRLNGKHIRDYGSEALLYLGHLRGLSLPMSVEDNVAFWAQAYGQPELIEAALHYFDLEDIADVPVRTLSAGWQQRVALTRLLTVPGVVWLLDEPLANLDQEGTGLLYSLLQTRMERGGIILLASHAKVQGERIKTINISEMPFALSEESI